MPCKLALSERLDPCNEKSGESDSKGYIGGLNPLMHMLLESEKINTMRMTPINKSNLPRMSPK